MTAYTKHIDLVFADKADKNDFDLITPASYDTPGRVRLRAARIGTQLGTNPKCWQLLSSNGGQFIGYLSEGEPLAPFSDTYWIEENGNAATH